MKYIYITAFVILIDQVSKIFIKIYGIPNILFKGINISGAYFKITFIENSGLAFGIDASNFHLLVTLITLIAIILLFFYLTQLIKANSIESLPMSLILGGAIGNGIDRVLKFFPTLNYNGVIDFISVGYKSYDWYIFNFADTFITIGLIIIIIQTFSQKQKKINE